MLCSSDDSNVCEKVGQLSLYKLFVFVIVKKDSNAGSGLLLAKKIIIKI